MARETSYSSPPAMRGVKKNMDVNMVEFFLKKCFFKKFNKMKRYISSTMFNSKTQSM